MIIGADSARNMMEIKEVTYKQINYTDLIKYIKEKLGYKVGGGEIMNDVYYLADTNSDVDIEQMIKETIEEGFQPSIEPDNISDYLTLLASKHLIPRGKYLIRVYW